MKKVILNVKRIDGLASEILISAEDSSGNSVPVFASIKKLKIFGNRIIIPNERLEEIEEIVIESGSGHLFEN
jgi:hypothetical protein